MSEFPSDVEYAEQGLGPALLFVPGSFATGAGWKAVMEKLGQDYRFVTTALLGYGKTAERRPSVHPTTAQQTEVLDKIFERIAAPVHVVAHSYGGLSVLAHALNGRHKAASLTLVEANPIGSLRTDGEDALIATIGAMQKAYFAEFEAGEPDAARHVIDFYGGAGTYDALPKKVRDYCVATTSTNVRDWLSAFSFCPPFADYRHVTASTLIIRGATGHPAMMRVAELLAANIPHAELTTIRDGGHFLPTTHPGDLAELIAAHVGRSHEPAAHA
jgi:pimeloyl-ACP methyl ester carboxylesterase